MSSLRVLESDASLPQVRAAIADTFAGGQPVAPLPADPVTAPRVLAMLQPDEPVVEPDAAVIVSTSGSTGAPKGVVLSRAAIRASAEATHRRLGGPGRWLLALPTHYVAGFMVVARATVAETPVEEVGRDLAGLARAVAATDLPTYLSLVPTQLARALDQPELVTALQSVGAVLLGGAPARPTLLRRSRELGITVLTTYGMSETCGGCVYDGEPLSGVEVGVDEPDSDGVGRILLGGPVAFSGYRLQPNLTASTLLTEPRRANVPGPPPCSGPLTPDSRRLPTAGQFAGATPERRWVRTNDRGRLIGARLEVLGRFDDVIVSGGLKIDLAAVERTARDWPALGSGEIVMLGLPDREWGTRLVAFAETPSAGSVGADVTADLTALQDFLSGRVARHERPRELIMMPRLPRTSSGKVDRQRLLADAIAEQQR
ncbi:AMP-binding protein [Microlunatus elymi]|uniref:AMP-binding protein n=1 Tax=Microlunatus elymi TaxID=2596828 RepID=A0A516Q4J1_9ACTN|nr:AMP-binding protein [Microlunatus elymi]QDP98357.1 AMP-binding protein [Microlunatus elymi]